MNQAFRFLAIALVSSMLGFGSSFSEAAKVYYRWIDDRGDPVHSDRPPPKGIDYEVISTQSSLVRPVDASEGAVPAEVEPSVSNEFEPEERTQPAIKKNPEYCQRARDNLETLDTRARIRVRNEKGEFTYIDEQEKERRREEAREAIDIYCE